MAKQVWGRHTKHLTTSQDNTKEISTNEWNDNTNRKGHLGFDPITIASGATVTPPAFSTTVADQPSSFIKLSGSTSVDTIAVTNTSEGDILYITTTGSVTLNNTSSPSSDGDIRLLGNANKDLSTTVPTILIRNGNYWYEYGGSPVTDASITFAKIQDIASMKVIGRTAGSSGVSSEVTILDSDTMSGASDSTLATSESIKVYVDTEVATIPVGDITAVTAGTALTGGGASGDVTVNADVGIGSDKLLQANANVADNDFLRIDGTKVEGRTAAQTLADIGAAATASPTFTGTVTAADLTATGTITGDVTGDVSGSSGSTTGNAATATALATARTIGGTSFDGTANIAVALSATTTALATARTIGGVSFDGTANINLPGVNAAGTQNTSGTAAGLSAQLVVASGGTNLTSYTAGDLLYATGATTLAKLAKGTAGQALKMNSGATAPEWAAGGGGAHTEQEWDVYTTHTPSAAVADTDAFMFTRKIDSNNDGLYIQIWKNGASTTVQIA